MPGLRTSDNFSRSLVISVLLCGIIYFLYRRLNGQNTSANSAAASGGVASYFSDNMNTGYANNVYSLLLAGGLRPDIARYATAQSANETAGFNSPLLNSNNNLFGMKYAGQHSSTGEKNGYANYTTINLSIIDFIIWFNAHKESIVSDITSLDEYVAFLKNNDYFTADEQAYLNNCYYYYNNIFT